MRPQSLAELGEAGFKDASATALMLVQRGMHTELDGPSQAEADVYDLIAALDEQGRANVLAVLTGLAVQWFLLVAPSQEAADASLRKMIEVFSA